MNLPYSGIVYRKAAQHVWTQLHRLYGVLGKVEPKSRAGALHRTSATAPPHDTDRLAIAVLPARSRDSCRLTRLQERSIRHHELRQHGSHELCRIDCLSCVLAKDLGIGFILVTHALPGSVDDFVDLVVPELQWRSHMRTGYEHRVLRERFEHG